MQQYLYLKVCENFVIWQLDAMQETNEIRRINLWIGSQHHGEGQYVFAACYLLGRP